MSRVAVVIVAWNSMKHLPEALASLAVQTHPDLQAIVVDNGSSDGAAEHVRASHPTAVLLRNSKNLGPARARNQGIAYAAAHLRRDGDLYILTMSPDAAPEPDAVAALVASVERRPEVASACGKVLRLRETGEDALANGERTDILDSTGLAMSRARLPRARGAGERDSVTAYARTEEVFGAPGAFALYRLQALESAASGAEFFDEDLAGSFDDADLAWRLRLVGWQALYAPNARAWRYGAADELRSGKSRRLFTALRGPAVGRTAYHRNRLFMRLKDERVVDGFLGAPWIICFELAALLVTLMTAPVALRAWPAALALLPRSFRKRRVIMRFARATGPEMRRWFK